MASSICHDSCSFKGLVDLPGCSADLVVGNKEGIRVLNLMFSVLFLCINREISFIHTDVPMGSIEPAFSRRGKLLDSFLS